MGWDQAGLTRLTTGLANFGRFYILRDTMVVHMRHTRAHTANRRSHHALKAAHFATCKDCGAKHMMHRACSACGKYRGRLVIDVLKKKVKATKRSEAKKSVKKDAEKASADEKK